MSTCKQIRREALDIYYCENAIQVSIPKWNTDALVAFHTQIGRLGLGESLSAHNHKGV